MSDNSFDLIVIGAGPGGYVAAIRAAQLGMNVACVEKRGSLGGTCLNVGCIPSKALLHSSELYHKARHGLGDHGIKVEKATLDLDAMMAQKTKVVGDLTKGIEFLFKKNKVTYLRGAAGIAKAGEVTVTADNSGGDGAGNGGTDTYKAANIVIATGSVTVALPGIEVDEQAIVSSTGALSLPEVPNHLVVVGGGYIGLELGSVWARLGSRVTVVEFLDTILATMDGEIAKHMGRILAKQGMEFRLSTKVTAANRTADGISLALEPAEGGAAETLDCDVVLVAVGRRPVTAGLGLEAAGVALDNGGRVTVDSSYLTNVEGIYAIGDVIEGPMLAHKAEDEGVVVAEIIAGQSGHVNYDAIPGVVYTWPEAASVGKTEEELKAAGVDYKLGKFPFAANSRGRTNAETDGFVKILADAGDDKILGAHIIGAHAGTMIAELVLAMEFGASAEDLARTTHAHPTVSEAVKEAALAVAGRAIHI
ncbi:MAG: dihydrolipoyl dehydrogenase [Proteobacteria bacterium]|nr:dihydrolipoyl dehydrogenase [Pseudomonadota bacterium]